MFRFSLALAVISALVVTMAVQTDRGGSIRFEDITSRSGVDFVADSSPTPNKNQPETMISGVGLIDYDNDGYLDIFFINGAAIPSLKKESPKYYNRLFHNDHDGTFTDVTEKAGLAGDGYDMGVAIGDFDNDGWQDIYVASVTKNQLYRNNGDGAFTDVSDETGISKKFGKGMGVGFNDYDGDGFVDIFVANDNMPNALFHNLKGKTFEEVAMDVGVAYSENGKAVSGM